MLASYIRFSAQARAESNVAYPSLTIAALKLHKNVDYRFDIADDVFASQLCAGLQHKKRQLLDRTLRTIAMDGRHGAWMTSVDSSQKGEGLRPTNFAENDTVGPHAQRGIEQIFGRCEGLAKLTARSEQANSILMPQLKLGRVLDQDQSLMIRDLTKESVQECRLASRGAAGEQDVPLLSYRQRQHRRIGPSPDVCGSP